MKVMLDKVVHSAQDEDGGFAHPLCDDTIENYGNDKTLLLRPKSFVEGYNKPEFLEGRQYVYFFPRGDAVSYMRFCTRCAEKLNA